MILLIAHVEPITGEPLPHPEVVASFSTNRAITRHLDPRMQLDIIASKLGLGAGTYEILESGAVEIPGYQHVLPL